MPEFSLIRQCTEQLGNLNKFPDLVPTASFFFLQVQHLKSLQSHYTTHTQVSVVLSPRAENFYLFIFSLANIENLRLSPHKQPLLFGK